MLNMFICFVPKEANLAFKTEGCFSLDIFVCWTATAATCTLAVSLLRGIYIINPWRLFGFEYVCK